MLISDRLSDRVSVSANLLKSNIYWVIKIQQNIMSVHHYQLKIERHQLKGSLQWKNDLGLYFTLVLVMKIGMCDLMIFRLV